MRREGRAALAAVAFLTRLPAGSTELDAGDVQRAGVYFPVVGAGLGAGTGALAVSLAARTSGELAGALSLALGTVLTGALHVDALADTADALGVPGRSRALEVMRDSRLGAFGVTAVTLDLLVKAAALSALSARPGRRAIGAAVSAGALSRAAPVALATALPYARAGEGTGLAITGTNRSRAGVAVGLALAGTLVAARRDAPAVAAVAGSLTVAWGIVCRRWLGGVTGDTLGAAVELTETAVLVAAVALGEAR